ncbi:MAG: DNA methyltransferase [Pyrinomonadaceae bacterium]
MLNKNPTETEVGLSLAETRGHSVTPALASPAKPISTGRQPKCAPNFIAFTKGNAKATFLADASVDLIMTSPAYWQKRDYGLANQIGIEKSPRAYVQTILDVMSAWHGILKPTGSVFLNVGDSFRNGHLLELPSLIINAAVASGWKMRQRIIWVKPNSTPHSSSRRLASREEYVLHFSKGDEYYYDLEHYKEKYTVGNVWTIAPAQHKGEHLAPFPDELVERVLRLACPKYTCSRCGSPSNRQTESTTELDQTRPQARRAMERLSLALEQGKLTNEHIAAIRATGISDAGKASKFQTGRNSEKIKGLATEAKKVLGGYFREFTFAKKRTVSWTRCRCRAILKPGIVYDPFVGTGTTLRVAKQLGFSAIGSDLRTYPELRDFLAHT